MILGERYLPETRTRMSPLSLTLVRSFRNILNLINTHTNFLVLLFPILGHLESLLAVSAEGFLARDITIENNAGPKKQQAVALRINADLAAMYRVTIDGYQDTLYTHSFRQFYRECEIYGTTDYIFGNAAVVFQGCNIVSKLPLPGQFTVITAQSRDSLDKETGIAMQNCSILATKDLCTNSTRGEYENYGQGSATDQRVTWPGYHIMDYYDATNFTVSDFIAGQDWLDSTSFPYDDGV
ncbi:Pectinesterase [Heracleum sosnowskyi]|uniref:Pectinesterase n=1 Tax=Heracleum sosnowskyi TaxID=360622 RepID=A0AAD8I4G6_9APIA|nr:Pectinesterase [Heracleum sosnowskyi]